MIKIRYFFRKANILVIIFICLIYYCIEVKYANTTGTFLTPNFDLQTLIKLGAESFQSPLINNFTAIFMHSSLIHLMSNMVCLWFLFDISYQRIGVILTDIVFVVTGFMSNLCTQILSPDIVSVGASGAVFGIAGMLLILEIYYRIKGYNNALGYVFSFAVYNIIFTFMSPNINAYAHFSGLAIGIILGILFTFIMMIKNFLTKRL